MLRVGNRVSPFFEMGKKGTIIEMKQVPPATWMVEGSSSHSWSAKVKFDNGDILEYAASDLMPIDD